MAAAALLTRSLLEDQGVQQRRSGLVIGYNAGKWSTWKTVRKCNERNQEFSDNSQHGHNSVRTAYEMDKNLQLFKDVVKARKLSKVRKSCQQKHQTYAFQLHFGIRIERVQCLALGDIIRKLLKRQECKCIFT